MFAIAITAALLAFPFGLIILFLVYWWRRTHYRWSRAVITANYSGQHFQVKVPTWSGKVAQFRGHLDTKTWRRIDWPDAPNFKVKPSLQRKLYRLVYRQLYDYL